MKYYATVKSHNTIGYWEEIKAGSTTAAKRAATARFGNGYIGDVILLVIADDDIELALLDLLPTYSKRISSTTTKWVDPVY